MRWKLLLAFGLGFTVVFAVVAVWVLRFTTNTASSRVHTTLESITTGGAATIDGDVFERLVAEPAVPTVGAVYPASAGFLAGQTVTADSEWPASADYWAHVAELVRIRNINPDAQPYSVTVAADGSLNFVASFAAGGYPAKGDKPDGVRFLQSLDSLATAAKTQAKMKAGLTTVSFDNYVDAYGDWVSAFSPIKDHTGKVVGIFAVDYPLTYVDQVRSSALRLLYPLFGVAYLVLLAVVVYLSGWLTRRLGRLSNATQLIADGDYEVDLSDIATSTFSDEMSDLALAFDIMKERVGSRERTLVRQVQVLKVEIDEVNRRKAVEEITDSDFFSDLTAKVGLLRAKVKAEDDAEAAALAAKLGADHA